jgi:transcription elongation factor GreA
VRRPEVADRLRTALEEGGDLSENAEYEDAKNEQAFVEGRIKELEVLLATARVVDEKVARVETIQVGSKVTIQVEGRKEKEEYTMVGAAEADPIHGKISNESPIGKALLNKKEGDKVQVETPAGILAIKVVKLN